jgi:hypothetical protein
MTNRGTSITGESQVLLPLLLFFIGLLLSQLLDTHGGLFGFEGSLEVDFADFLHLLLLGLHFPVDRALLHILVG